HPDMIESLGLDVLEVSDRVALAPVLVLWRLKVIAKVGPAPEMLQRLVSGRVLVGQRNHRGRVLRFEPRRRAERLDQRPRENTPRHEDSFHGYKSKHRSSCREAKTETIFGLNTMDIVRRAGLVMLGSWNNFIAW